MVTRRTTGWILFITAIFGILVSLAGLVLLWVTAQPVSNLLNGTLDISRRTLSTSQEGLAIIAGELEHAHTTVRLVQSTSGDIATSLDQTIPGIDNAGKLVGEDMAGVLENTQTSLTSAQQSAKVIDDSLRFISRIPLIGFRYNPPVPLDASIAQISQSLQGMPASLRALQASLNESNQNLREIQGKINELSADTTQFDATVTQSQSVITRYQGQVAELQAYVDRLSKRVPFWLSLYKWGGTLFLIWLGFSQVGRLFHALGLLRGAWGRGRGAEGEHAG